MRVAPGRIVIVLAGIVFEAGARGSSTSPRDKIVGRWPAEHTFSGERRENVGQALAMRSRSQQFQSGAGSEERTPSADLAAVEVRRLSAKSLAGLRAFLVIHFDRGGGVGQVVHSYPTPSPPRSQPGAVVLRSMVRFRIRSYQQDQDTFAAPKQRGYDVIAVFGDVAHQRRHGPARLAPDFSVSLSRRGGRGWRYNATPVRGSSGLPPRAREIGKLTPTYSWALPRRWRITRIEFPKPRGVAVPKCEAA